MAKDNRHEPLFAPIDLAIATVFLTRLPAPVDHARAAERIGRAAWAFPLVGGVVGAVAGAVYSVLALLGAPPLAAAALGLGVAIALTGALHEDGWADLADGLGSGATGDRLLEIMRDSRIGAAGATALILMLAAKASAVAALPAGPPAIAAAAAAGALGRAAPAVLMAALPKASGSGLAASLRASRWPTAMAACLLAAVIALGAMGSLSPGIGAIPTAIAAAAVGAGLIAWVAWRRLGGQTGDVLGAAITAADLGALLAFAAVLAPS